MPQSERTREGQPGQPRGRAGSFDPATVALAKAPYRFSMLGLDPITASIGSAIAFGVADFMGGRAALRLGSALAVALVQSVAALFVLTVVLVGRYPIPEGRDLYLSLLAGLADGAALILLYHGLAVGRISIVAPLTGVFSIAVPAIVEALLVTEVGPQVIAGMVLAAIAVVLIAHASGEGDANKPMGTSVWLGIASGITFGITTLFLGLLEPEHANGGTLLMRGGAIAIALVVVLYQASSIHWSLRGLAIGGTTGILDALGVMGLVYSATTGLIGVAVSINALYAGVTVLLGVVVLGERLERWQLAGLGLGGVAILLLAKGH